MESIQGKVALVAGAGGAVGSHISRTLLETGCKCALTYRSADHEFQLTTLRDEFPGMVELIQADLNDTGAGIRVVERTIEAFTKLDFLINPVGGWLGGKRVHEHSLEEFDRMVQMDFRPTFALMRAVLPVMAKQGSGKIVNFSSMAGVDHPAQSAVYAASKAAVETLSNAAAVEYGPDSIQVYTIAPEMLNTESNRKAMPDADTEGWTDLRDVGEAVVYLCTSGNALSSTTLKLVGKLG